ncbi:MAG: putative replication protein A [Promethearchaeota archaeon]|nr:MAG: putative replication protein A [Candidatus Lokiarchaeota archaeon]
MKIDNYIKRIIEDTGLSKKEIQDLVDEKKEELKGLISEEGALFIIAKELGVDIKSEDSELLDDIELNVSDIKLGMKNIILIGRVKAIYKIHTFKRKDGNEGKVGSFLLHDTTGDIRIVLWDDKAEILTHDDFDLNELVKVVNGYVKENNFSNPEIHVGRLGKIELNPKDVDYAKYPKISQEPTEIGNVNLSHKAISVEGKIIRKSTVNTFEKKDGSQGKVASIQLIDSTGSIRVTFWNENVKKLNQLDVGQTVKLTNLSPRQSNMDPQAIELNANFSTKIKAVDQEPEISGKEVKDIKSLQNMNEIVSFKGVISSVDNLKEVTLKSGDKVALLTFNVSDETDAIRVTLWREFAEKYSEVLEVNQGVVLKNVLPRFSTFSNRTEISFIPSSELELIDLKISDIKELESPTAPKGERKFTRSYTKISEIDSSDIYEIKGVIVKLFNNITIYEACSNCYKKIDNCTCQEPGEPEKRMILNMIIDDGTGTIRTTFIGEQAEEILGIKTKDLAQLVNTPEYETFVENVSQTLLGKDLMIRGKGKYSEFSSSYELNVYEFKELTSKDINVELENTINKIEQL